jgi:hypothetical protein
MKEHLIAQIRGDSTNHGIKNGEETIIYDIDNELGTVSTDFGRLDLRDINIITRKQLTPFYDIHQIALGNRNPYIHIEPYGTLLPKWLSSLINLKEGSIVSLYVDSLNRILLGPNEENMEGFPVIASQKAKGFLEIPEINLSLLVEMGFRKKERARFLPILIKKENSFYIEIGKLPIDEDTDTSEEDKEVVTYEAVSKIKKKKTKKDNDINSFYTYSDLYNSFKISTDLNKARKKIINK